METILDNINLQAFSKSNIDINVIEYFEYVKNTDDFSNLNLLIKEIWSLINKDSKIYTSPKIAKLLNINIDKRNTLFIKRVKFIVINPNELNFNQVKEILYSIFKMDIVEYFFIFINNEFLLYPHEDFGFGIIDKSTDQYLLQKLTSKLNKSQCNTFVTGNRK